MSIYIQNNTSSNIYYLNNLLEVPANSQVSLTLHQSLQIIQDPLFCRDVVDPTLPIQISDGTTIHIKSAALGYIKTQLNSNNISDPLRVHIYSSSGILYSATARDISYNNAVENSLMYLINPSNSTSIIKIGHIEFSPLYNNPANPLKPTPQGQTIYRIYLNPTLTSLGTNITPINMNLAYPNASIVSCSSTGTFSSFGTNLKTIVINNVAKEFIYDLNFSLWLNAGSSILITAQNSGNNFFNTVNILYGET